MRFYRNLIFFPTITIWQLNVNFTYILNNYSFITFVENNIHIQDSWQVSWALGLTLYVGHLYGCDNNHGPFGPVRLWTPTPLGLSMLFVLLLLIAMTLDTNLQDKAICIYLSLFTTLSDSPTPS